MSFKEFFLESDQGLYHIYCDMDGVLVNFSDGFKKLSGGIGPEKYEEEHGTDEFWKIINKEGESFWTELQWLSDGKQLWGYIKKYNPTILSTPSKNPGSKIGKLKWIKQHIQIPDNRIILSDRKEQYVESDKSILIDDRDQNIEKWDNSGGIGIKHINTISTIKKLKELGL